MSRIEKARYQSISMSAPSTLPVRAGHGHEAAARAASGTIWIVLPTYNEAENLRRIIPALEAQVAGRPRRILIVDDASTDSTASVIEEFHKTYDNIVLYRRPGKRGLGSALREGLMRALADPSCDRICTLDADLSHDPHELGSLLAAADGAGFVQGSRYVRGGHISNWPWHRRLMSRTINWVCRLMGSHHAENTTNYRVYDRTAATEAITATASSGFEWIVLASLAIQRAGISTAEVPITFRDRQAGKSKLSLSVAWRYSVFLLGALVKSRIRSLVHLPARRSAWR